MPPAHLRACSQVHHRVIQYRVSVYISTLLQALDPVLDSFDLEGIAKHIQSGAVKNIVCMVGAGVSVSAGIPDFRSPKTGALPAVVYLHIELARHSLVNAAVVWPTPAGVQPCWHCYHGHHTDCSSVTAAAVQDCTPTCRSITCRIPLLSSSWTTFGRILTPSTC